MTIEELTIGNSLKNGIEEIEKFIETVEVSTFKAVNKNDYSISVPDLFIGNYLAFMGKAKQEYLELLKQKKEELQNEFSNL